MGAAPRPAAIALLALAAAAPAVAAQETGPGAHEYRRNCAVCHGETGRGDGPMAEVLAIGVPDLTGLARANGGVFPVERLQQVIDGRAAVAAHGSRDMPVWGDEYVAQAGAAGLVGFFARVEDVEGFVRGRILALIEHLSTLQEP